MRAPTPVVPLTDGAANPDSVEQVTVTFEDDLGGSGVVSRHDYAHYVAGAAAADTSTDPAVHEQVASLHAHGFLATPDRPGAIVTGPGPGGGPVRLLTGAGTPAGPDFLAY